MTTRLVTCDGLQGERGRCSDLLNLYEVIVTRVTKLGGRQHEKGPASAQCKAGLAHTVIP
jgi:hypothetical protein